MAVDYDELFHAVLSDTVKKKPSTPRRPASTRPTSNSGGGNFTLPQSPNMDRDNDDGFFDLGDILPAIKKAAPAVLDLLDTPRAAIVSTIKERNDAARGEGFDLGDWWTQTWDDNIGFGDLVETETPIENIWVKRGLGLAGDVALDPFTYLAGASAVTRLGRTGMAAKAFEMNDPVLAQKILQKGISSIKGDEMARISKFAGDPNLVKGIHIGLGKNQKRITKFGSGQAGFDKIASVIRKRGAKSEINDLLGGRYASTKIKMMWGTPKQAQSAFLGARTHATEAGRIKPFDIQFDLDMEKVLKRITKDPNADYVRKNLGFALGGDTDIIKKLDEMSPGLYDEVDAFRRTWTDRANLHVDPSGEVKLFTDRDDWHGLVTATYDDILEFTSKTTKGRKGPLGPGGQELKAKLIPGNNFLGVELLPTGPGMSIPQQVSKIIADHNAWFGEDALRPLFNEDIVESLIARSNGYKQSVFKRSIEHSLAKQGLAVTSYMDDFVLPKTMEQATSTMRGRISLQNARERLFREQLEADSGRRLLRELRDVIDSDGAMARAQLGEAQQRLAKAEKRLDVLRRRELDLELKPLSSDEFKELGRIQAQIDDAVFDVAEAQADGAVRQVDGTVDGLLARRDELAARIDADPAEVARVTELLDVAESARSGGLFRNPLTGRSQWYHGTTGGLDLGAGRPTGVPNKGRLADSRLGVHLGASERLSRQYANGRGKVLELQIFASNPKVFDVAEGRRGSTWHPLFRDMYRAWTTAGNKGSDVFDLPQLKNMFKRQFGVDVSTADIARALDDDLGDPWTGLAGIAARGSNPGNIDVRRQAVEYLRRDLDLHDAIADNYKRHLQSQGFDSVVYTHGARGADVPPTTSVIALDPSQVQAAGSESLAPDWFRTVDDHMNNLRANNDETAQAIQDEIAKLSSDVEKHTLKVEELKEVAARNSRLSLDEAQDKLERTFREQAKRALKDADELTDPGMREAAQLSGIADAMAADVQLKLRDGGLVLPSVDDALAAMKREDLLGTMEVLMKNGFKELSNTAVADDVIVETIQAATRMLQKPEGLLRHVDTANRFFKTWAVFTPGFHARNFLGGTFNNYLAGVDPLNYARFGPMHRRYVRAINNGEGVEDAISKAIKGAKPEYQDAFAKTARSGQIASAGRTIDTDATFGDAADQFLRTGAGKVANLAVENPLTKLGFRAGNRVEDSLRGVMAFDSFLNGDSTADAVARVAKYHFDYSDLAPFEQKWARRIVPFYTWSRKNLPLQIEGMLTNPKAYTRILHLKRNLELGTEEEEIVPGYVRDTLNIRTPWKAGDLSKIPGLGGFVGDPDAQLYIIPDLPFRELTRAVDPGEIFGSTSPYGRIWFERKFDKKSFNNVPFRLDAQPIPEIWTKVGIAQAMSLVGAAHRGKDGEWYATDKDIYTVEQMWPVFARMRRLAPNEDEAGFKDRQATTFVNFMFGAGAFTNTERAMTSEILGQERDALEAARSDPRNGDSRWNWR